MVYNNKSINFFILFYFFKALDCGWLKVEGGFMHSQ